MELGPYTLLGFTGTRTGAGGMHVWESSNGGIFWDFKTTLTPSGNINAEAAHRLSGSEFLLSHCGAGYSDRGVMRLSWTASRTLVWATVFTGGGFHKVLRSTSGDLLMGWEEEFTVDGGGVYQSVDQGSSWFEQSRIAKQGNIRLIANSDGTLDALISRTSVGIRTDRYRNFEPGIYFSNFNI